MKSLGPVIATVLQDGLAGALASARASRELGADRVELRVDAMTADEARRAVGALAAEMPLLVSGRRDRLRPGEIALLREAQSRGAHVDIPWGRDLPEDLFGLDRSRLVLSHHDTEGTPRGLDAILAAMREAGASFYKLVPTARDFGDLLTLKEFLGRCGAGGDLCAFSMGSPGMASRILALAWGSSGTYASAPGCLPAAPGQISLGELIGIYSPREASVEEPLYAVIGWPLHRTGSPALHNTWLRGRGLPGRFVPIPVHDLEGFFGRMDALPFRGLAVTIPHKEHVSSRVGRVSRLADRVGACNTIIREDGGWIGANTDAFGVRRALGPVARGTRTLLLGAGGAASAVAAYLSGRGPLTVTSRDPSRAASLAARHGAETHPWNGREGVPWDLLVNATPVGQEGEELPIDPGCLWGNRVFDLVVRHGGTPLLRTAVKMGLGTVHGEAMLEAQGRLQFRLFTGVAPPR